MGWAWAGVGEKGSCGFAQPLSKPSAMSVSGQLPASICFPLFTQQRTLTRYFGMSEKCHKQTHALQQIASLFNHLVGAAETRHLSVNRRPKAATKKADRSSYSRADLTRT